MLARKVKLRLNHAQRRGLEALSRDSFALYNLLLCENFTRLDDGERALSAFDMINFCRMRKLAPGMPTDVVAQICQRLARALTQWQEAQMLKFRMWLQYGEKYRTPLKAALRRTGKRLLGRPRFKRHGVSIQFPLRKSDQKRVRVFGKQTAIRVPLVGVVKGYNDRQEILGLVKMASIHKDTCGDWWATIICDGAKPPHEVASRSEGIGVDLGLKHTVTAANEREVIQPVRERFLERQMAAIQKASRERRRDLPFLHRKIARRRKHSHHVMAKHLLEAAQTVYVGNLRAQFLFSGRLARSASDAAHAQFLSILSYKAANAGKSVVMVNEAYTSQTCYSCGIRQHLSLAEREYRCSCGYGNNRDVNAALNILRLGERQRPEA